MSSNNYLSLKTFVPGTKAKADEVNSNFNILKESLMTKALAEGDSTQVFYVADAVEEKQAINKSQLNTLKTELQDSFKKFGYRFCIRYGNTTQGEGDLFDVSYFTITPKIGGTYPSLVVADYTGEAYIISSAQSFTMQGKANGTYNVFIKPDGDIYAVANTIYSQKSRPELVDGDIWLNTSCEPLCCTKYSNNTDVEFNDVPIGKIVIENDLISSVTTNHFLDNGYEVTYNNLENYKYDYGNPVVKTIATSYTAESDGLLYVQGTSAYTECKVTIDGEPYIVQSSSSPSSFLAEFIPIFKGQTYLVNVGSSLKFIPKIKM